MRIKRELELERGKLKENWDSLVKVFQRVNMTFAFNSHGSNILNHGISATLKQNKTEKKKKKKESNVKTKQYFLFSLNNKGKQQLEVKQFFFKLQEH